MNTPKNSVYFPKTFLRFLLLASALWGASISLGHADDKNWISTGSNAWTSDNCWGPLFGRPAAGDNVLTPAAFGTLQMNTAATVANWDYNSSTTWVINSSTTSSLTVSGTLSKSGAGLLHFRGLNNPLSLTFGSVSVTSGELRLGDDSVSTQLQAIHVSGTTSISTATVNVDSLDARFGEIAMTGGNLRIFRRTGTGAAGSLAAAGLSGTAGIVSTRENQTASVSGTLTFTSDSGTDAFGGNILNTNSGTGMTTLTVVKQGAGAQILSGSNSYSGGTTITGGTLLIENTGTSTSGVGTGSVVVLYSGVFGGTGRAALSGSNAITLSTGGLLLGGDGVNASGTLTIANNLSLTGDARLGFVLGTSGSHSALARSGTTTAWSFAGSGTGQKVRLIESGTAVATGTYSNLITGLAADPGVASWTVANSGWSGSFTYNSGNVSLALLTKTLRAFDGPGFGAETPAGFGPSGTSTNIIRVTTLSGTSTGTGSLLGALSATTPRIVIFEVSGTIDLAGKEKKILSPYLTIAGQTAPPPGITLIRGALNIQTHDVLIQDIRVRTGDGAYGTSGTTGILGSGSDPYTHDAMAASGTSAISAPYNVVIDHTSVSWGTDETFSLASADGLYAYAPSNITFSNNLISEGLHQSIGEKQGGHSRASSLGNYCKNLASIRNVYAHFDRRMPLISFNTTGVVVNTLIFDPGTRAMMLSGTNKDGILPEAARWAFVGNQVITGTSVDVTGTNDWSWLPPYEFRGIIHNQMPPQGIVSGSTVPFPSPEIYEANDQYRLADSGSYASTITVSGSTLTVVAATTGTSDPNNSYAITPLSTPPVWPDGLQVLSLDYAYQELLAHAGARPAERVSGTDPKSDPVDWRIIQEVETGTETYAATTPYGRGIINSQQEVGGYPVVSGTIHQLTDFTSTMTAQQIKDRLKAYTTAVEVTGTWPPAP